MARRIHIKIADRGWILEKCARAIASCAKNVSYSTDPDPTADLQYYINYSARTRPMAPVEVGFFTHSENETNARRRYFDTAREVDHCVCMSSRYAEELIESGISPEKITTIAPGVDLQKLQPKIRVGVVGRTYHTGRKGEALVAEVMDVAGIEWRFTGSGWPRPSVRIAESEMADFYNSLDYVLVPSLYEGGPMSVLEGLACGIPIISSDVGWVSEYPHIPFETGNAESLRNVLTALVAERQVLRDSVLDRTWDRWADEHLKLFDRLLSAASRIGSPGIREAKPIQAMLVTHGTESKSIGGPSVRVPRTAAELGRLGVSASLPTEQTDNFGAAPLAHLFNVWPAESCFKIIERARAVGKRTVLSPIFLNLSNIQFAAKTFPKLFSQGLSDTALDAALSEIAIEIAEEPNLPVREPFAGFHERVRACVEAADEVIFLSEHERSSIEFIGATPASATLIRNPVDAEAFSNAGPELFRGKFGIEDYILCVGRVEPRKNQLMLAHAAKTLGRKVVFIGHTEDAPYYNLVREVAGDAGHFIARIDPADPLLKSAFAGASAFCLPSWAEGAPLAALEAAAVGLPLVLSDRSSEREYFGDFAEYVNPADVAAIRTALESAIGKRHDEMRRAQLQEHVVENNSWDAYARATADVYERVLASKPIRQKRTDRSAGPIYFDLTTTFHASGHPTGIARVEDRALRALIAKYRDRIVPVLWNGRTQGYLQISRAAALAGVRPDDLERLQADGRARPVSDGEGAGARILVLGGAWIRNPQYIAALETFKRQIDANLTILIHDLIQMKLRHLYPEGVGDEFATNARLMARVADDFLVYSECTKSDLREFLAGNGELFKKISKFRLGDMTGFHAEQDRADEIDSTDGVESALQTRFSGKRFAIYVSTIEIRKNHALLINVWRRLVEERGAATPHLVFIGRSLWRGQEVVDSIERDDALRPFVHVLEDVDDRDLDWFYRNCVLTLYPSLYEGWGLPVAESLSYGKMCIASDRTATREIAPELTDLADPYDFRAWHDRVAYYFDNPSALQRREEAIRDKYTEHGWDDSVQEIVSILDSSPKVPVSPAVLMPGETVEFFAGARPSTGTAVCAGSWGNVERGGRWSLGGRSKLVFRYPAKADEFHIRLRINALTKRDEETRSIRIRINDVVDKVMEVPGRPSVLDLAIPVRRSKGESFCNNEIVFEPLEPLSPNMVTGSADTRLLGVYLVAAQVADDVSALSSPPAPPAAPGRSPGARTPGQALKSAKDLVKLPARFTGNRPLARFARAVGFDRLWLRMHARQFRRTYASIGLIVDYLQHENRG
jgi:glycosyltransferase involved in cell wall biosynthesis